MMDDLGVRLQKAADAHCVGLSLPHDLGIVLLQEIFKSDGKEEDRWVEHEENACPKCGGSGLKGDQLSVTTKDLVLDNFLTGLE